MREAALVLSRLPLPRRLQSTHNRYIGGSGENFRSPARKLSLWWMDFGCTQQHCGTRSRTDHRLRCLFSWKRLVWLTGLHAALVARALPRYRSASALRRAERRPARHPRPIRAQASRLEPGFGRPEMALLRSRAALARKGVTASGYPCGLSGPLESAACGRRLVSPCWCPVECLGDSSKSLSISQLQAVLRCIDLNFGATLAIYARRPYGVFSIDGFRAAAGVAALGGAPWGRPPAAAFLLLGPVPVHGFRAAYLSRKPA